MSDHNKKLKYVHSPRFIWYLSKWPQSYLLNFVGANWWQFRCGRNTISNRWNERAIGNCFKISNQKCEDLCKPWKKVIALLKVRIKMQCCFKCRRGSWPLLIFAICLSIAAPASSYLLLIFPLQMSWLQQSLDCTGVLLVDVVVLVFLAFFSSFLWWALMWQCWLWWWWCLLIFSSVSIFWNAEPTCSPRWFFDPDAWPRRHFSKQQQNKKKHVIGTIFFTQYKTHEKHMI